MSAVLFHDEEQRRLAEESRDRLSATIGTIYTSIVPLDRFYMAEEYHQKYRLRNAPALFREMRGYYPDADDFRDSTAAARLNGYLDGNGTCEELEAEIDSYGLSVVGNEMLKHTVCVPIGR
jgi:peptide-methionine (S)-S-oxide reductase